MVLRSFFRGIFIVYEAFICLAKLFAAPVDVDADTFFTQVQGLSYFTLRKAGDVLQEEAGAVLWRQLCQCQFDDF